VEFDGERLVARRRPVSEPFLDFVKTWGLTPFDDHGRWSVRHLSHMFLHGDVFHLLGNLMTMWVFLPSLEAAFGRFRFLVLYVMSGIAGGLMHWAVQPNSSIPMIGASGAISGMIGAYLVLFGGLAWIRLAWNGGIITGWKWVTFQLPAGLYVFFWLVLPQNAAAEFAVTTGEHLGVAWFAHAGGFAMGLLFTVVQRGDVLESLHYSREGNLTIGETEETRLENRQAQVAAGDETAPPDASALELCCYCRTPLIAGQGLSEGLVRCGNPTCGKLHILGLSPAPTKKAIPRTGVLAGLE
jgi:membrane associated rhomboid family serine protease